MHTVFWRTARQLYKQAIRAFGRLVYKPTTASTLLFGLLRWFRRSHKKVAPVTAQSSVLRRSLRRHSVRALPSKRARSNSRRCISRPLVVRIARPLSLAIWHRGHSHRRPNRSQSQNHRHFASLDLGSHADLSYRKPASQDFRGSFCGSFPVNSDQPKGFSHRWSEKNFSHR